MEPAEKQKEGHVYTRLKILEKGFYAWQWWKREDVIKADGNRLYIRNNSTLLHITPLFITMAADKSTTGYRDSEEMNSFTQKETHVSWEAPVLVGVIFLTCSSQYLKGNLMDPCTSFILLKLQKFTLDIKQNFNHSHTDRSQCRVARHTS